ncbi:MAG: glycoside hydrolase family 5 protein [Chloroflexota bacterium]
MSLTTTCVQTNETAVSPTTIPTSTSAPTATPTPEPITGPVGYYGELIARGNRIHGAKTDAPAQVRGMSFFWSNTGWQQDHWYTAATVDRLVDEFNVELVRAAMGVEEDGGYLHDPQNKDRLETVVQAAIARDIYVIIDWHTHHAEDNTEEAVKFFAEMAEKYGHHDHVIFELYNEPLNTTSWQTIKTYAEQVIPAIRQHSDNLIVVGTRTWSQNVAEAAQDPIDDPNLAYSLHFYVGSHGNGVRQQAETALANGVALFVTEWGIWPEEWGPDGMDANDWMAFVDEHQLSWANWAISNKSEPPSFFNLGSNPTVTENGRFVQNQLNKGAADAPWR